MIVYEIYQVDDSADISDNIYTISDIILGDKFRLNFQKQNIVKNSVYKWHNLEAINLNQNRLSIKTRSIHNINTIFIKESKLLIRKCEFIDLDKHDFPFINNITESDYSTQIYFDPNRKITINVITETFKTDLKEPIKSTKSKAKSNKNKTDKSDKSDKSIRFIRIENCLEQHIKDIFDLPESIDLSTSI